jgi:hypothetical protein
MPSLCPARTRRRLPSWLGFSLRGLFIGLIFYFIFASLWQNWGQLHEHDFSLKWQPIVWSYVVFGAYLLNRALIWHWMTLKFGCAIPLRGAVAAWFYSLLGKYVPGKVFLLAGRLHFYGQHGRSSLRVGMCFMLETICVLLAAILVLLIAPLATDIPGSSRYRAPAVVLVVAFLVAIRPKHLELLARPLLKLLKRPPLSLPVRYRDTLSVVAVFTLNWTLLGVGFFLFTSALYPMKLPYLFYLAGSFALASTVGILALFAPAGLGVREGVLVVALSAVMPHGIAIVVTLASRVWMTLGELLAVGLVALASRGARLRTRRAGQNASHDSPKADSPVAGPAP